MDQPAQDTAKTPLIAPSTTAGESVMNGRTNASARPPLPFMASIVAASGHRGSMEGTPRALRAAAIWLVRSAQEGGLMYGLAAATTDRPTMIPRRRERH